MTKLKAVPSFFVFAAALATFALNVSAQERDRIAKPVMSQPVNQQTPATDKTKTTLSSQPLKPPVTRRPLTTDLSVSQEYKQKLISTTADSRPISAMLPAAINGSQYGSSSTAVMLSSIKSKFGIPYRYGASGPNGYDCSGFVWAVFSEAGLGFTRTSAQVLWNSSEPVEGDEKYKFGTLVFFNSLGHMGIVADANGFYHASSSKGIMYSPFKGYWEKRIVGFRKLGRQTAETAINEAK